MRYLTAEELKGAHREDAHGVLGRDDFAGKSIRDRFAIALFERYHRERFGDHRDTRILDLGAAAGAFLSQLVEAGYENLYGTDIDEYLRPALRVRLQDFKTVDLSWSGLPWPDGFFDVVTAWCVLPHLENPFHAVREVARVLKPGGLFIFTAPYLASKPSRDYFRQHGDFKSYRTVNNHIVLFPPGVVGKTILRSFRLIATEYHARFSKIFRGPKGLLRRIIYRLAAMHPRGERMLQKRWAYNIVYILRKP